MVSPCLSLASVIQKPPAVLAGDNKLSASDRPTVNSHPSFRETIKPSDDVLLLCTESSANQSQGVTLISNVMGEGEKYSCI